MKCLVSKPDSHSIRRDSLQEGEKCFTLVRLLLVIALFGALVTVLVPRISTFLSAGQTVAANREVASVEIAAQAYWVDNGEWPPNDCNTDLSPEYLNKTAAHHNYEFDADGLVIVPDGKVSEVDTNVKWNEAKRLWEKD